VIQTGLGEWQRGELPSPPRFQAAQWMSLIGPGLMMAGTNIGGGEWLMGPLVTAQYGGRVMWLATVAIGLQVCYNLCIQRYSLYCGESILIGFLRTPPGLRFWTAFYLVMDLGSYWPYLAANAAVPLTALLLQRLPTAADDGLVRALGYAIFLAAFIPLVFGGKIYNSLQRLLLTKLFLVLAYLGLVVLFWVGWDTKWQIATGFLKFGALPEGDFNWATLAAFAAISGAGGLSNITFSNMVRDKGWGMGSQVGALPSLVGGHGIELSHTGRVFPLTPDSLARWRGWVRHLFRDQTVLWGPACLIGVALPAMMSYEFIRGATNIDGNAVAAMTAQGLADRHGQFFWFANLACGFLILFPTQTSNLDGIARRWTDVIWMGARRLHHMEGHQVKYVYYGILVAYGAWGLVALRLTPNPLVLAIASAVLLNFAMAFSTVHVLWCCRRLMPPELRPPIAMQVGVACCGLFYAGISAIAFQQQWPKVVAWLAG
jgi:hypothetical protein